MGRMTSHIWKIKVMFQTTNQMGIYGCLQPISANMLWIPISSTSLWLNCCVLPPHDLPPYSAQESTSDGEIWHLPRWIKSATAPAVFCQKGYTKQTNPSKHNVIKKSVRPCQTTQTDINWHIPLIWVEGRRKQFCQQTMFVCVFSTRNWTLQCLCLQKPTWDFNDRRPALP